MSLSPYTLIPKRRSRRYLLLDQFTTDDAAPVASPRTCEPGPGTLTFVQTDGTFAISSAKLAFGAQTTPVWGDQGFYGAGVARAAGTIIGCTLNIGTWEECGFGLHTAAAVVDPDSTEHAVQLNATDGQLDLDDDVQIDQGLSASTDYGIYFVLRASGCHLLKKVGSTYTLLWVDLGQTTATLYPMFSNLDGAGTLDHLFVTKAGKWSPVPIASDSFNRADSTNLGVTDGAGAEEVGGSGLAWVEVVGSLKIASNVLTHDTDTGAGLFAAAVVDAGQSDIIAQANVSSNGAGASGFVLRYVDADNCWVVGIYTNTFKIWEFSSGTFTTRASAAPTIAAGTLYPLLAVADGATITAYLSGANRLSYGSATLGQTSTRHGFRQPLDANDKAENFVIWARTQTLPSF